MDLAGIDESFNFNDLGALELDFCNIFRRDDHVLLRLELIALDYFLRGERLVALLAFLLVTDRAVILLVQLIEPDRFLRVHRVVNADGNGNQRKPNVTFPYRSHNLPRFRLMVVFIGSSEHETCQRKSTVFARFPSPLMIHGVRSGLSLTNTGSRNRPSFVNETNCTSHISFNSTQVDWDSSKTLSL